MNFSDNLIVILLFGESDKSEIIKIGLAVFEL